MGSPVVPKGDSIRPNHDETRQFGGPNVEESYDWRGAERICAVRRDGPIQSEYVDPECVTNPAINAKQQLTEQLFRFEQNELGVEQPVDLRR